MGINVGQSHLEARSPASEGKPSERVAYVRLDLFLFLEQWCSLGIDSSMSKCLDLTKVESQHHQCSTEAIEPTC